MHSKRDEMSLPRIDFRPLLGCIDDPSSTMNMPLTRCVLPPDQLDFTRLHRFRTAHPLALRRHTYATYNHSHHTLCHRPQRSFVQRSYRAVQFGGSPNICSQLRNDIRPISPSYPTSKRQVTFMRRTFQSVSVQSSNSVPFYRPYVRSFISTLVLAIQAKENPSDQSGRSLFSNTFWALETSLQVARAVSTWQSTSEKETSCPVAQDLANLVWKP